MKNRSGGRIPEGTNPGNFLYTHLQSGMQRNVDPFTLPSRLPYVYGCDLLGEVLEISHLQRQPRLRYKNMREMHYARVVAVARAPSG